MRTHILHMGLSQSHEAELKNSPGIPSPGTPWNRIPPKPLAYLGLTPNRFQLGGNDIYPMFNDVLDIYIYLRVYMQPPPKKKKSLVCETCENSCHLVRETCEDS